MKNNPLKEGALIDHAAGIGMATRDMVSARAAELAVINGRPAREVTKSDLEQARRELTGEVEADPLEEAPESDRWNVVPGSTGHKVASSPSEDEDDEGRSDGARLVEEGIAEAEHDQMLKAHKAGTRRERI